MPEEYWQLHASLLTPDEQPLRMEVTHYQDNAFKPVSSEETQVAVKALQNATFIVKTVKIDQHPVNQVHL